MCFWWFMLICDMIIPIVMVIVGRMMWKHCPKHINGMLGYRTTRSMKNMDTWKFAHDYCGKTLVENRMGNDPTICFDTYSVIP